MSNKLLSLLFLNSCSFGIISSELFCLQTFFITLSASPVCFDITTGQFSLIIPDLTFVISSIVLPKNWVWSRLIVAITLQSTFSNTLVASVSPPIPHSIKAISQFCSLKNINASAVSISKDVGCGKPSLYILSHFSFILVSKSADCSSDMYSSFILIISRSLKTAGEQYLPTLYPDSIKIF